MAGDGLNDSALIFFGLIEVLSPKTLALFHNLTTVTLVGNSMAMNKIKN